MHDRDHPRYRENGPLDQRDQFPDTIRVFGAGPHKGTAPEGDIEHVGHKEVVERLGLRCFRLRLPARLQRPFDLLTHLDEFIQIVPRWGKQNPEYQISVACGQVFCLGQQAPCGHQ
ncbi:uncharacterized protein METZ01_LOCUS237547 [marine metagenome]|uniref:Uncharacterized protein n=1 Tax=marine metagenome TaxID=408172 RepID=A0A382HD71_9ZZZZ